MRFIFSTGSLYTYGTNRCFELAAQAGFDGIELMTDRRWDTRQPEYLRSLIERYDLPIVAVHVPLETDVIPGWPEDYPGWILRSVELAETLGADVVVHHLPLRSRALWVRVGRTRFPIPYPGHTAYERWLLMEYPALQAATRVRLCIENMPGIRLMGRRWNVIRWNTMAEIVRFPSLTMDTTHLGTWGLDPAEIYGQIGQRVYHVHLSNFNGKQHRRPEDGWLRLDRLLNCLADGGYTGAVCLEMSPDALSAGSPDSTVAGLMAASLADCRAVVRGRGRGS